MVEVSGSKLSKVSFEDLAEALDKDPAFREAVVRHLGAGEVTVSRPGGNQVTIETKASFVLDDSKIFDLNGEGLKITAVAVN